ncbi:hypothetical protein PINS_up002423 [Pythium insidiosum]|nr:hypothetical protein PINS_up002423 [Pythium insidiosum]
MSDSAPEGSSGDQQSGESPDLLTPPSVTVSSRRTSRPGLLASRSSSSRLDVRQTRSSTVSSSDVYRVSQTGGWRHDAAMGGHVRNAVSTLPPSNLLYRMLYTKSSSRDLWSSQAHHRSLHNVARSVMFSLQLKKEHVFEHFFVAGAPLRRSERAASERSGLAGFWKPSVLFEFPLPQGHSPDASIADFCFPAGVPVVQCKAHVASALQGTPVTLWTTDAERLQRHSLDPFRTSGYTFRLTGAKGEVLYGLCVAVMTEVTIEEGGSQPLSGGRQATSPRNEWSKRASCPNGAALLSRPHGDNEKTDTSTVRNDAAPSSTTYMAPVCYCVTSKFPFYRLHFALLRMIIENEERSRQCTTRLNADQYELTLTVESTLQGIEFATSRHPNVTRGENGLPTTSTGFEKGGALSSVSTALYRSGEAQVTLSEEAAGTHGNNLPHRWSDIHGPNLHPLKRSLSSDDISSYNSSASCVVEQPVVVRLADSPSTPQGVVESSPPISPRLSHVRIGDVLEAIDGIATSTLTFSEAMELLNQAPRPLKLRFQRLVSHTTGHDATFKHGQRHIPSPSSIDILHRVRSMKIGEPGEWSSVRLPHLTLNYQFPKRHAERWSIGVALRFLQPASIVKVLAYMLLEKQVVVMGESSAKVTAICTALLLLLSPFQWQSTYIPQLPSKLLDFLHSPVPFIVGCQPLQTIDEWSDVCFYDIDSDVVIAPITDHHISPTSIPHGEELQALFQGAQERYRRLRVTGKPWHELSDEEDKVITLTMKEAAIYMKDMCGEHLGALDITSMDGKSFYEQLQDHLSQVVRNSQYGSFLEEFSQTQLFCQYCESVLKPMENTSSTTKR